MATPEGVRLSSQSKIDVSTAASSGAPATRSAGWRNALQTLGNRNFRLFLLGMFCSSTGVWTQRIAQDWLVLDLTNSPTQVGITTMLQYVPMLFFGLLGGLAADRYSRRRILVGTQIGMMVMAVTLAALTLSHEVRPWQVFVVAFLVGTIFAFDIPARQSFVNELVAEGQVRNAIGLTATVFQVGALIGPAASGALISAVGPGYAFTSTAAMYLVPMAALLRMNLRGVEAAQRPSGPGRVLHELHEGLRYVAGRPEILWTIVLVGTFGTFVSNLPVTNAAFARLVFHNGPGGYGLLGSVAAIGSVLGALFAATRHRRPRLRSNLAAGGLLAALYMLASVVPGFVGYAIVLVAIGAVTITFMTSCNSTIQISAGVHVRGRVMGLYNLFFIGGGAAGGPLIGAVDQYAGPRVGMLVSGAVPALITVFVAVRLARRRHRAGLTRKESAMTSGVLPVEEPICRVVRINPHRWNGRTLVMTHGAWHSARHYLRTFDERPGWAYDFALAGYRVLIAEYPGTAGSPPVARPEHINTDYICRGLARVIESVGGPVDLLVHSMSGPYGYSLLETHGHLIEHLVAIAPAEPPELAARPDSWTDLGSSIRTVYGGVPWEFPKAGWTLGSPTFVATCIGTGTRFPPVDHAIYQTSLVPLRAELSVEHLRNVLEPPSREITFSGGRVLVVIGTHDRGHPRESGAKIVAWLNEHGAAAELMYLGEHGIQGNGHMPMLEDNSSEIAQLIANWLEREPAVAQ